MTATLADPAATSAAASPAPPAPAEAPAPVLTIRGLQKAYGKNLVLRGVDLTIAPGEVTFLIGPSGGGKSTLLRCINFLETPTSGEIVFQGQRLCDQDGGLFKHAPEKVIREARTHMPMVFQHFNLFSHRTVMGNLIEGPTIVQKRPRKEAEAEAMALLEKVGLADKHGAYPAELSGGQKQRIAIARALAMRPALILFDEPTSALDPELVAGVLETIRSLAEEGRTMIVVSHEMKFARRLADTVHFISGGVIEESGPPEQVFDNPRSERLQGFINSILD
jgi:ABC-type polar amino acid transport system ATPase subunit